MDLEQLERSVLEASKKALAPAASDRMRNQATLLDALKVQPLPDGAAPTPGSNSAGNNSASRDASSDTRPRPSHSPTATSVPLRASTVGMTVGLTVGLVFGGLVGFTVGQQLSRTSPTRQALPSPASSSSEDTARAAGNAGSRTPGSIATEAGSSQGTTPPLSGRNVANDVPTNVANAGGDSEVSGGDSALPSAPASAATLAKQTTSHSKPSKRRSRRNQRSLQQGSEEGRSTLAAELALLQRARRALRLENGGLALGIVHSLDEQFAQGVLLEERSATRVLALCQLDRQNEARKEAQKFLLQYPQSVYARRVRSSCIHSP